MKTHIKNIQGENPPLCKREPQRNCYSWICTFILLLFFSPLADAKNIFLSIDGLQSPLLENMQNNLSLYQASLEDKPITAEQFQLFLDRAPRETAESLQPFGYYEAKIDLNTASIHNGWKVHIAVVPGPITKVRSVSKRITGPGAQDPLLASLFTDFKPKVGEPLLHEEYEKSKVNTLAAAISLGYPFAYYTVHDIDVFPHLAQSDIHLVLETGALYHVGTVQFGPSPFDNSLLKRFVHFDPDARYNTSIVADLQRRLGASRYIKHVQVTPSFDEIHHTVPLQVDIEPQTPNQYITGFGYGTDIGIRGRLGWERRYFNRYGHGLNTLITASQRQQHADLTYIIPGKDPSLDHYETGFRYVNEELADYTSEVQEWSLSSISELQSWHRNISVRLHEESYRENVFLPKVHQSSFLPRIILTKTKRDDLFNPASGYKLILSLQGVMDRLTDADNFIQAQIFFKKLTPLREGTSLMVRTELGATFPNNINELPLSLRYFAGGDNSIRGFRYKSVRSTFPALVNGKLTQAEGGRFLSVGSLEVIQKLFGNFSGSVFVDAGGAYNTFDQAFVAGAGLGIRWISPIGPIRLECAKPVSVHPGLSRNIRVHLAFGPEI